MIFLLRFPEERYVVLCLSFPSFLYTIILTLMHKSDSDVGNKVDSRLRVIIPAFTCSKNSVHALVSYPDPALRRGKWSGDY